MARKPIRIKKKNRGKLRAALGAKAGKNLSVKTMRSRLKRAGPALKRRIVFALNARKWSKK